MITRYALFEGVLRQQDASALRETVLRDLLPTWTAFPTDQRERISFTVTMEDGAPGYPLILAV